MNCCFYHCKGLFKRRILSGCNIILFALLLCSYSYLLAGEKLLPVYDFRKIDRVSQNAEGMSKEQITSRVVRDNHGFIWIGTIFGLLRYDGYIVHTYRHDPKDPYSLSSNIITALFVDSKQRLWVGTDESGLSLYDARNNWFINFLPRKGDSQWLQSKRVRAIIEDDSGSIWLATRGGIAQVEINVTAESNNIDSLVHSIRFTTYPLWDSSIETYNLIMQNDNTFLIASDSGLVILDHTENKTYSLPFTDQLDHTHLSSIIKDSRGNIWAGAESGEGLFRIDLEAKKLWNYRYKIDDNTSPDSDIIFDLAEDRDGNIWVCSREGVHLFSPRSNSYLSYLTFDRALIGKTDFSKIHIDNIGVIWLSIYGKGVHKFDPNYQCFPGYSLRRGNEYLPITFLTVDRDYKGNFWFFSIEGILYQIDIDKLQIIKSIDVFKGQKPLQYVFNDSFLDANGTYWYGSMGLGLFRVDLTSGQVKNYGLEAGLGKNLTVNSIAQGRGDTLWTATYLEGLMKFDPLSQKFIRVPGLPYTVWSIMRDRTGRIWISAGIDGIIIFDPVSGKKEYLRNDPADPNSLSGSVCYSFEDKEGRIWVGAGTVIDLWEPSNRSFIHYPEKEFSCAVKIDPIGYDSKGRLWSRCLGPGLTVSIINPVSRKYTNFAHEQGINGGNMVSLPDGRIIKTGGYGINIFDLDSIQFKRPAPPLVLTRLNINNEPVVSPHLTKNLKLTYTQNLLEFEFAAISVNVPTQIRYQYQLAGLENSWMDPPKIQEVLRYVKYSNLDPGNYIFKVKATSPYGDWQEQQISLPISISPPGGKRKLLILFM